MKEAENNKLSYSTTGRHSSYGVGALLKIMDTKFLNKIKKDNKL